uniref:IQ domain-containing protein F6 n=1 Tax=Pogona vitticeps TaxID=103695 RepID=A0A6J0UJS4_9SAUR
MLNFWKKVRAKICPCLSKPDETSEQSEDTEAGGSLFLAKQIQAAVIIQKWWRGVLVRRSLLQATLCALVIQRWWRHTFNKAQEERRIRALVMYIWPEKSTILLQSMFRMWLMKTRYKKYQKAAQVIQNNWRRYSFRRESNVCSLDNLAHDGIDLNIEIVVG